MRIRLRMMESSASPLDHQSHSHSHSHSHSDASRPSLGFPLGTGLLLILVFTLSGVFSCCYHWDKFRHPFSQDLEAALHSNSASKTPHLHSLDEKEKQMESVGVIMPGDEVPKFIALPVPVPCEPLRPPR